MAQTYVQLQQQIEKLQEEAQRLKKAEIASVVMAMQENIRIYGISPADLFGKRVGAGLTVRAVPARAGAAKTYTDGRGNVWGGRGPRPAWLRKEIAAGRKLEDFLVGQTHAAPVAKAVKDPLAVVERAPKAATASKKQAAAKKSPGKKPAAAKKAAAKKTSAEAKPQSADAGFAAG